MNKETKKKLITALCIVLIAFMVIGPVAGIIASLI